MRPVPEQSENSFNAIRLLAAIQVAALHAAQLLQLSALPGLNWLIQFQGVPIFFVLSGFLVFESLLRLQSLRRFTLHRMLRIYPALFANIVVLEFAVWLAGGLKMTPAEWAKYPAFLLYYGLTACSDLAYRLVGISQFALTPNDFFPTYPSGVLWTLTVELTFYLVMPLFLIVRARIPATALILALSAGSLLYTIGQGNIPRDYAEILISISIIPYFWIFAIGMLFRLWMPPQRAAVWLAIGGLLGFIVVSELLGLDNWYTWKTSVGFLSILKMVLLGILVLSLGLTPLLSHPFFARYDASYGTYLWHPLIMAVLAAMIAPTMRGWWLYPAMLGISVLFGMLSWRFIELPAMGLRRRIETAKQNGRALGPKEEAAGEKEAAAPH